MGAARRHRHLNPECSRGSASACLGTHEPIPNTRLCTCTPSPTEQVLAFRAAELYVIAQANPALSWRKVARSLGVTFPSSSPRWPQAVANAVRRYCVEIGAPYPYRNAFVKS